MTKCIAHTTEHLYVGVTTVVLPVLAVAMGLSFIAPIVMGIMADSYGLGIALSSVGFFPLLACAAALVFRSRKAG